MATVRVAAVSCLVGILGFASYGPNALWAELGQKTIFQKENKQTNKNIGGLRLGSDVAQSGSVLKIARFLFDLCERCSESEIQGISSHLV